MRRVLATLGFVLALAACETTSAPPATAKPAPSSCLMTHICGCNLGCARVTLDPLREGARVKAETGPYAGQEMIVTQETDATGASVFTLSDRERNYPCALPRESKSLMGFACAAKDSGPVPAKACASGCD